MGYARNTLKFISLLVASFFLFTAPAQSALVRLQEGSLSLFCVVAGDSTVTKDGSITVPVTAGCIPGELGAAPPAPTQPSEPSGCGTLPQNTVVVDTGSIATALNQVLHQPSPQRITAFKVKVPEGFAGRSNFAAAITSSSAKSKLLVVSACPGVLKPVASTGCVAGGTETTTLRLSSKASEASYYCKLPPGVYYVNAVSKNSLADTGYNCTSTTNCSFYASRSAPY